MRGLCDHLLFLLSRIALRVVSVCCLLLPVAELVAYHTALLAFAC